MHRAAAEQAFAPVDGMAPGTNIDRHRAEFEPHGPALAQLRKLVAQTRRQGSAMTDGLVTAGVGGVGMSFEIGSGGHAAISIAAISSRMQPQRKVEIARLISDELRGAGFMPTS